MTNIELRSNFKVDLIDIAGSDQRICEAARVSTLRDLIGSEESAGLINFLMTNRHGSPFEHGLMTFRIEAPIMVWREFMRHRIGWSYNEQSGRYTVMTPQFYIPPVGRPLVQVGKAGQYSFVPGTLAQQALVDMELAKSYQVSWDAYENLLEADVGKEVARLSLPVAIYSTAYTTCNPRSLMAFLSLRTKHEGSTFPSYPQWEINQVANQMEAYFEQVFPLTHEAFNYDGRVSP